MVLSAIDTRRPAQEQDKLLARLRQGFKATVKESKAIADHLINVKSIFAGLVGCKLDPNYALAATAIVAASRLLSVKNAKSGGMVRSVYYLFIAALVLQVIAMSAINDWYLGKQ